MKYRSTGLLSQYTTISAMGICGMLLTLANQAIIPTQPEVAAHSRQKQPKVALFRIMNGLMPKKYAHAVKVFLIISARQPCFLTARVWQRKIILLTRSGLSWVIYKQRPSASGL